MGNGFIGEKSDLQIFKIDTREWHAFFDTDFDILGQVYLFTQVILDGVGVGTRSYFQVCKLKLLKIN